MRLARRAGNEAASTATATSDRVTAAYVSGSPGDSPNSMAEIARAAAYAATVPKTRPSPTRVEGLAQDHPEDLGRSGAECHAHADLTSAPQHGVRHQPIESDRRQAHRHETEQAREAREQQLLGVEPVDLFVLRAQVEHR